MRRSISMAFTTGLAVVLALGVAAVAQSSIQLNAGAGQSVTFSGQGSGSQNVGVALGSCGLFGGCTLSGSGAGTGSLASSGSFTINSTANSIVLTPNGNGGFAASASAPINFNLSGSANGQTGTLLSGALNLLNFSQAQGSSQGSFNTALGANLNVTGGLLANAFTTTGGILNLNVQFPSNANISSLVGTNLSLTSTLSASGAGGISPTPEPSTLALAGLGLLVLGLGLCLHRRTAAPVLAV
ncbi:MAG: PEP-CTERM sorting domain-containing protein [Terriglobales bacterium]